MTLLKAAILGLIQGIAEFLPISSSGHLSLFKHILNINLEGGLLFDVILHFGTLIAIFIAFWKDIKKLIIEGFGIIGDFFVSLFRKDKKITEIINTPYRKFVMLIIVSTIPTGILGILLSDVVEKASATILVPGICLLVTGILLLIADHTVEGKKRARKTTYKDAAFIGVAQGIATMPGLSRSGTTITACLLCGFDKNFAVRYSFIMSIPAVLGAAVKEALDFTASDLVMTGNIALYYFVGMVIAAVVGYICIKTMLMVVRGKKYKYFAIYCFIVGLAAIIWNFAA